MNTFEPFPKLARLKRGCVITEKLDGTNAQVAIIRDHADHCIDGTPLYVAKFDDLCVYAGSRTRIIMPGKTTDNYGFAAWVRDNAEELIKLGEGRHFGEWYGKGIQRGYGLQERRFALFHNRALDDQPKCVEYIPTLYTGDFDTTKVDMVMEFLKVYGSQSVPGFMYPEGVVVYHQASRMSFKVTYDDRHKEAA